MFIFQSLFSDIPASLSYMVNCERCAFVIEMEVETTTVSAKMLFLISTAVAMMQPHLLDITLICNFSVDEDMLLIYMFGKM